MKRFLAFAACLFATASIAPAQVSSNSFVNFHTPAGDMVVELFDSLKPVTVQNFLRYVQSGAYDGMFLHRAIPGFIVQGGGTRVDVGLMSLTNGFNSYLNVTNYGNITNEYLVGQVFHNTYGTIAMAKLGGDPNSASSQWFFNLANNSANLDNQNGGFTVFGHVVSGTNVLNYFNNLAKGLGIVDLTLYYGSSASLFTDLPVHNQVMPGVPAFNNLDYTEITVINAPDVVAPSVSITSPTANETFTNAQVTVRGTAGDNLGVTNVLVQLNNGAFVPATGTLNWSAPLNLVLGTNIIRVKSVDPSGNQSVVVTRTVFYSPNTLSVTITGGGTISPNLNGLHLVVGRSYRVTAVARPGQIFSHWSGGVDSTSATIVFVMQNNLALTANFVPNPFLPVMGTLNGLTTDPAEDGALTSFVLDSQGGFSGRLTSGGVATTFHGKFSLDGSATISLLRPATFFTPANPSLTLNLDLAGASGHFSGTLAGGASPREMTGERAGFNGTTRSAAVAGLAGRYTLLFQSDDNSIPGAAGYGLLNVDAAGVARLTGAMADGTVLAQNVGIGTNGFWPIYLSLFHGSGALVGPLSLTNPGAPSIQGSLTWQRVVTNSSVTVGLANKPATLSVVAFPVVPETGTLSVALQTKTETLSTSAFVPRPATQLIHLTNGTLTLEGPGYSNSITGVTVLATGALKIPAPNTDRVAVALNPSTGLMAGSFVHPQTRKVVAIRGVVLQDAGKAQGYFVVGNQVGQVSFGP